MAYRLSFSITNTVSIKTSSPYKQNGDVREYIINPYTMVANGGKYYLICNYDKYDNLSHYRIDRISNIEILDTPRKPKNRLRGLWVLMLQSICRSIFLCSAVSQSGQNLKCLNI